MVRLIHSQARPRHAAGWHEPAPEAPRFFHTGGDMEGQQQHNCLIEQIGEHHDAAVQAFESWEQKRHRFWNTVGPPPGAEPTNFKEAIPLTFAVGGALLLGALAVIFYNVFALIGFIAVVVFAGWVLSKGNDREVFYGKMKQHLRKVHGADV